MRTTWGSMMHDVVDEIMYGPAPPPKISFDVVNNMKRHTYLQCWISTETFHCQQLGMTHERNFTAVLAARTKKQEKKGGAAELRWDHLSLVNNTIIGAWERYTKTYHLRITQSAPEISQRGNCGKVKHNKITTIYDAWFLSEEIVEKWNTTKWHNLLN